MTQLHPQIREVLRVMAEAGLRPIEEMTPAEAREQMEATARARKAEPLRITKIEERLVPRPGGAIRLRLYWPLQSTAPMPAIVYFHGGGHVIGSLDTHDFVARNLCGGTGAMVASVDYRMGPEHKFPAAVDDCFAALQWVHANAASLGADPDQIGVQGDSGATGVEHAGHAHARASAAPHQSVEPPQPLGEPSASSDALSRSLISSISAMVLSLAALSSSMVITSLVFCNAVCASRALR